MSPLFGSRKKVDVTAFRKIADLRDVAGPQFKRYNALQYIGLRCARIS